LFYASTIWRMRLMALTVAYGYAVYVVINLVLFTVRNPPPTERGDQIFGIVYSILAVAITWGTAIYLSRRKADLT
ncbi:MAG TPA: hypothetical protein VEU51_03395, partial [Candidatus Acidoferrales bacterium]|nr:hypothetical protein [Candidatus Acidoferrales bacterium]